MPGDDPDARRDPGELCVVGDADQSIYAFRGATIRNIVEFEQDYPDARTILLEQNYRSTQTILRAANSVIARNESAASKNLWTDSGDGPRDRRLRRRQRARRGGVRREQIDRLGDDHGVRPGDVAVFYRTNAQSRALEEVFVRVGLPYKVVGGTRFYERREVKDALAYLRVISNPTDTVNLRRIVNVPKRGIGDRAEACIAALAERERIPFVAALGRPEDAPGIATRSVAAIKGFTALLEDLGTVREDDERGRPTCSRPCSSRPATSPSCAPATTRRTRPGSRTSPSSSPWPGSSTRRAPRPARWSASRTSSSRSRSSPTPTRSPTTEEAEAPGVVTLMTLHTAKGLEFPVVFLTGMEDGTFPHLRSLGDPKELEEERRLAYVGITRARERLLPVAGGGPVRLGRAAVQPAVAVPRRDPGRAGRVAARLGPPPPAPGDRSAGGRDPGGAARRALTGQPAGHPALRPATGSPTTATGWARWCAPRARATRRRPTSTSAETWASSASCCATRRSRSSDSPVRECTLADCTVDAACQR